MAEPGDGFRGPVARPLPAHWLRHDILIAAALALLGGFLAWLAARAGAVYFERPALVQAAGSALLAVPLVWRRRWPLSVGAVHALLYGVLSGLTGFDLNSSQIVLFLSFFTIGAWSPRRSRAALVRALICVGMGIWLLVAYWRFHVRTLGTSDYLPVGQFLSVLVLHVLVNIAFFAGAWYFGDKEWSRALKQAELEEAYADIRQLRSELVEAAVSQERLRIARELHDVVAHHVTAMSVQAAAARRVLGRDPERATTALTHIESSARQAVGELRTLVRTLRSDGEDEAAPTIEDLPALVERARRSGARAELERIGDLPPISPLVGLTLYRVAQEALTNAAKHAGPHARVAVRLRGRTDSVELEVSDDGYGAHTGLPGTGTGIVGMRERLAAVGGTLETGAKPRGGFRVRARIPVGGAIIGAVP